ncbi:MAG: type II toxin-antitoxin system Phd/YefM family antitoxin [Lachnospiraceae bacterium]|nr:type II toxin-antitoxin system Phd/YefM family antitoxin [Lachnospiraceae bacterium]
MPTIMPIRDLRKTSEISELAHKQKEPIFITKNGYSDLVVMSAELYEQFAFDNKVDQAIYESEKDYAETGRAKNAKLVFEELEKKYFGQV